MMHQTHIETVTKGPNQRVRRTIAYRVVANRKEIARFEVGQAPDEALASARQAMLAFEARMEQQSSTVVAPGEN